MTQQNKTQNVQNKKRGKVLAKQIVLFCKNNWKKIFLALILLVVLARVGARFAPKDDQPIIQPPVVVETFRIGQQGSVFLGASCVVQPITDVNVVAQEGGSVTRVYKEDGDIVNKGEILFDVENTSERVSLADANASLQSAQFALEELLNDNDAGIKHLFLLRLIYNSRISLILLETIFLTLIFKPILLTIPTEFVVMLL